MESEMPDNCHQKSFPITCQAMCAGAYITLENQNLATTAHEQKDDSNETVRVGIPIVFVFASGGGPWKAKVKIPRAAECLSSFNICEAKDVPQNGMSYQMHSTSVCMNLCYLEPDHALFHGRKKKSHVWCFELVAKEWKQRARRYPVINRELC